MSHSSLDIGRKLRISQIDDEIKRSAKAKASHTATNIRRSMNEASPSLAFIHSGVTQRRVRTSQKFSYFPMSRRKAPSVDLERQKADEKLMEDEPSLTPSNLKNRKSSSANSLNMSRFSLAVSGKTTMYSVLDEYAKEVRATKRAWWKNKGGVISSVRSTYDSQKDSERQGNSTKSGIIREARSQIRMRWKEVLRQGRSNFGIFVLNFLDLVNDIFFAILYISEAEYARLNFFDPRLADVYVWVSRWLYVARSDAIFYLASIFSYVSVTLLFFKILFAETRLFALFSSDTLMVLAIAVPFFILDALNERLVFIPYGLLLLKGISNFGRLLRFRDGVFQLRELTSKVAILLATSFALIYTVFFSHPNNRRSFVIHG
jgi:hypothetical protein